MGIFIKRGLLIIFGLVLSFIILELIARQVLPPPNYILVKNTNEKIEDSETARNVIFNGESMPILFYETKAGFRLRKSMNIILTNETLSKKDISISTNSLGYRGPEISPKTENDFRILVIGDSITLADHVNFPDMYTTVLEEYLQREVKNKGIVKNIQVINAGIGGTGSQTQLAIYTELFPKVKPDMVIFQLYLNDANSSFMLEVAKKPEIVKKSRLLSKLYTIYIDKAAQQAYKAFTNTRDINAARAEFYQNEMSDKDWKDNPSGLNRLIYESMGDWGYAWDNDYPSRIKKIYSLIKEISDNHNIDLAVFMFPVSYQVQAEYVNNVPQRNIKKVMNELDIQFYDLLPDLRAKYEKDRENIFFDHCHLKPEGHEFVGKLIGKQILNSIK